MIIRKATYKDYKQFQAVTNKEQEEIYKTKIAEMNEGKAVMLVAEDNSEVVGHVFLKYYGLPHLPEFPFIEGLAVRVDKRKKGIGSALLQECEKYVKEKGYPKIGIQVNPELNCPARVMYEKRGFKDIGNKPYLDGVYDGTEDWVIDMVKEL